MKKIIKNLKLYGASIGLGLSLAAITPMSVYAEEEETLFESVQDDHTETDLNNENPDNTKQEEKEEEKKDEQITIDADNWNKDEHPDEGNIIPDSVLTEAERKGITPPPKDDEPPKNEEPKEEPKKEEPQTETKQEVIEKEVVIQQIPKTGDSSIIILGTIGGVLIASYIGLAYRIYQNFEDNKLEDEFYESELEDKKLTKKK